MKTVEIPHPRYYGDGEDTFSKSVWESTLWALLRETYARKTAEAKLTGQEFIAPDYITLVECEEILEKCGLERTWRVNGNVVTKDQL